MYYYKNARLFLLYLRYLREMQKGLYKTKGFVSTTKISHYGGARY